VAREARGLSQLADERLDRLVLSYPTVPRPVRRSRVGNVHCGCAQVLLFKASSYPRDEPRKYAARKFQYSGKRNAPCGDGVRRSQLGDYLSAFRLPVHFCVELS
jgi:hypothetical protein